MRCDPKTKAKKVILIIIIKKRVPTCEPKRSRKTRSLLGKKLVDAPKKENKSSFRAFPYFFWFIAIGSLAI